MPLKNHQDKVGPVSTMAFVTCVWMTVCTVAEILADRGVKLYIHPSHNVPGDTTAHQRLGRRAGRIQAAGGRRLSVLASDAPWYSRPLALGPFPAVSAAMPAEKWDIATRSPVVLRKFNDERFVGIGFATLVRPLGRTENDARFVLQDVQVQGESCLTGREA